MIFRSPLSRSDDKVFLYGVPEGHVHLISDRRPEDKCSRPFKYPHDFSADHLFLSPYTSFMRRGLARIVLVGNISVLRLKYRHLSNRRGEYTFVLIGDVLLRSDGTIYDGQSKMQTRAWISNDVLTFRYSKEEIVYTIGKEEPIRMRRSSDVYAAVSVETDEALSIVLDR